MLSKIIHKDKNNLIINWEDKDKGVGQLIMRWDGTINKFILDSDYLGINSILEIIKSLAL